MLVFNLEVIGNSIEMEWNFVRKIVNLGDACYHEILFSVFLVLTFEFSFYGWI